MYISCGQRKKPSVEGSKIVTKKLKSTDLPGLFINLKHFKWYPLSATPKSLRAAVEQIRYAKSGEATKILELLADQ